MNYRQLKDALNNLTEDQLDMDVTVFCSDWTPGEFYSTDFLIDNLSDVLDNGHPVITSSQFYSEFFND